jgi:riboflavin kinase / FMN adenylyltransferase
MIVHHGYDIPDLVYPVVTLGIFDGVHRGHRALLEVLVNRAKELNGDSVVITFSPHPRLVLEKEGSDLSFLTSMEEKCMHLENAGIGHLVILEFSRRFSEIPACDFVRDVLVQKIGIRHLVIGYNHRFGRQGEGDFSTVKHCSESFGFGIEKMKGLRTRDGIISSSLIRRALLDGRIEDANRWLGYQYSLTGTIVEGKKIGRVLGFPTANIRPVFRYKLIPANGVYAVRVGLDGILYPGMLSIGSNPTVNRDSTARTIEVNILNFSGNIYGKEITLFFHKKLRDEIRFENTGQLMKQMELDKQNTIRLLG